MARNVSLLLSTSESHVIEQRTNLTQNFLTWPNHARVLLNSLGPESSDFLFPVVHSAENVLFKLLRSGETCLLATFFTFALFFRSFLLQHSSKQRFCDGSFVLHSIKRRRNPRDVWSELAASILPACVSCVLLGSLYFSLWLTDVWCSRPRDRASMLQVYMAG